MKNRGQVTIFIIVAIVVVAIVALLFLFYPEVKGILGISPENPSNYLESCIGEKVQETASKISLQGGSLNPEHYILYDNEKIEYLCYSEEYYRNCVVQQPMIKEHVEEEIAKAIEEDAYECLQSLKKNYERQGYNVNLKEDDLRVELLPKRIVVGFGNSLTLAKGDSMKYDNIEVILNNNLYELVSIANSIIRWETNYGDVETTTYMNYYHDLKVEKKKQSDGTTVYILTDRNTLDKFQFASRSVVLPPGYGIEDISYA